MLDMRKKSHINIIREVVRLHDDSNGEDPYFLRMVIVVNFPA